MFLTPTAYRDRPPRLNTYVKIIRRSIRDLRWRLFETTTLVRRLAKTDRNRGGASLYYHVAVLNFVRSVSPKDENATRGVAFVSRSRRLKLRYIHARGTLQWYGRSDNIAADDVACACVPTGLARYIINCTYTGRGHDAVRPDGPI